MKGAGARISNGGGGEGGRRREGLSLIQKSHYFSIHYNLNGPRIIPQDKHIHTLHIE